MVLNFERTATQKKIHLAVLVAVGLIIFIFESFLPRPFPWTKPGLANVASLLALYWYGWPAALLVTSFRVILGALILGTIFNPAFFLSVGGGLSAVCFMGITYQWGKNHFSMIGISVVGAFFHNLAQLTLAAFVLVKQVEIFYFMPLMLLGSVFTGIIVGLLSQFITLKAGAFQISFPRHS